MKNDTLSRFATIATFVGFIATMHPVLPATAAGAPDKLADLGSVLGELRKGGFVIYFRHTASVQAGFSDDSPDLAKCETQRNLSAAGREQATQIGKAFQVLKIPVSTVTASPFCRTKDTANLAFGHFTVDNDLYFAIGVSASETAQFTGSLRRMLSTPPAKATNAVIVSHSANLHEAAGIWPKPEGMAYVFRPLPGGKFDAVAMVAPEDWRKVAASQSPHKSR